MNYLLVIIATVLLAFDFAISKKYQAIEGTELTAGLRFNALNGLFTAVIFFFLSGFQTRFSLYSAIMAFLMSLFVTLYSILGFRILKAGNMALYSLFLMSGGMLLPYIFGILFLNEDFTLFRILGVIFILAAVILSNKTTGGAKYSLNSTQILLCILIFVLNGMVSIVSKCHQINITYDPVDSTAFVMYSGVARFLLSSSALIFIKPEAKQASKWIFDTKKAFVLIGCSALIGGVSYMFQLIGAKELPATVLYPMVTGGSIIFSALCGKFFFKEKMSTFQIVSIILCFIGTCLFL